MSAISSIVSAGSGASVVSSGSVVSSAPVVSVGAVVSSGFFVSDGVLPVVSDGDGVWPQAAKRHSSAASAKMEQ